MAAAAGLPDKVRCGAITRSPCKHASMLPPSNRPGWKSCTGVGTPPAGGGFEVTRFRELTPDAQDLIKGWCRRARTSLNSSLLPGDADRSRRSSHREAFQAFIFAWIGFNGWASCCCDDDSDRKIIRAVSAAEWPQERFVHLSTTDREFGAALKTFSTTWPIFRSSDVREESRALPYRWPRQQRVSHYVALLPDAQRAPDCHLRHDDSPVPTDLGHTLEVLYRVRCNLFHGTKSMDDENDRELVEIAVAVLVPLVSELVTASLPSRRSLQ